MNRATFLPLLKLVCQSKTSEVFRLAKDRGFSLRAVGKKGSKDKRRYAYKPGASPTSPLVVCHADTVVNGGDGPHGFAFDSKTDTVTSIALDDRLGVACMFHAIDNKTPLADCAMLICDDEEIGYSSAQVFKEKIKPNFLVELDRRGVDVVCYDYDSVLLRSLLKFSGFTIGNGSFSDICYLQALGVVGFNVGIGYHNEHSVGCHAKLSDTEAQIARLLGFIAKFGDVRLEYDEFGINGGFDDKWWRSSLSKPSKASKSVCTPADYCDACGTRIGAQEAVAVVQGFTYCEACDFAHNQYHPDSLSADDFQNF